MSEGVPARSGLSRRDFILIFVAVIVWVAANLAVVVLARGSLPFDRPALAGFPFAAQMAAPSVGMIEIFLLMGVVWLLTRRRPPIDLAARAPEARRCAIETMALLGYAMLGQAGGWWVGPAFGGRPFSFHIAGTLFGCTTPPSPSEVLVWAGYNFVVFALVPYLWFRGRYSPTELNLTSNYWSNDVLVILVVGVIEGLFELATLPGLFRLNGDQLLLGGLVAFAAFFIGTVLPTMILIYAILLPRYLRLTGSYVGAIILGGLTYAAMHIVEGWSRFDTPSDIALSLIFVVLTYLGPGMIKSFLTLRTGNAWVHALGYHAIAPHVLVDAPLMAKVFALR